MLTADPCEPMPGPLGAFWPTAKPGIDYCGPYPACCPAAARTWLQGMTGLLNPHGDWTLIALAAVCAACSLAVMVAVFRTRAQLRRRRPLRVRLHEGGRRR
jgi:hypothetical protein